MEYNKDDNRPILVQFENGLVKEEFKSTVQFKYLRSTVPKSHKRMLLADGGQMMYSGNILQKQQSLVRYYVGVVDRATSRIEHIEGAQLCTLKPKLKDEVVKKMENDQEKTYRQKSDTLVEAFGSAKQKRLLSSRKKNESVHESIGEKVADVAKKILLESPGSRDTNDNNDKTEVDEQIIPPMDMNAKKPAQVFHIDDIISFQHYQLLKQHSKHMVALDNSTLLYWQSENKYPEFVMHHLSRLPLSSAEREERCCYLCYINYLITFSKITFKELRKREPCPDIPSDLLHSILDTFTQSENGKNRCIPKKYKDKILCYILVLALIIEDYDLDCKLLIKDLKLGVARLTKLLRAIGCTVRTSNPKRKAGDETQPGERTIRALLTISQVQIKSEVKTENRDNVENTPVSGKTTSMRKSTPPKTTPERVETTPMRKTTPVKTTPRKTTPIKATPASVETTPVRIIKKEQL